ncbi:MAG: metallophosphoesterase [Promethearchaeota archaeon]
MVKLISSYLIITILIFFLIPMAIGVSLKSPPKGVRLNLIEKSGEFIVVISWYTESKVDEPKVKYWEESSFMTAREVIPTVDKVNGYYFYSAELSNLKYDTKHYYQVFSDSLNKRGTMSFTTLPKEPRELKFVVIADTAREYFTLESELLAKNIFEFIEKNEEDIDFFIHCGDLLKDPNNSSQWKEYFEYSEKLASNKFGLYVEGDHDIEKDKGLLYEYVNLNGPSYSLEFGDLVSFVSFSTEREFDYEWISNKLQESKSQWKIVLIHTPLYHTLTYRPDRNLELAEYFREFDVDVIFTGHSHYYERMYVNGSYYITSPKSGAGTIRKSSDYEPRSYSQYFNNTPGYLSVKLYANKLVLKAYGYNEKVSQCFQFEKKIIY